jgi:hypothetical protein
MPRQTLTAESTYRASDPQPIASQIVNIPANVNGVLISITSQPIPDINTFVQTDLQVRDNESSSWRTFCSIYGWGGPLHNRDGTLKNPPQYNRIQGSCATYGVGGKQMRAVTTVTNTEVTLLLEADTTTGNSF